MRTVEKIFEEMCAIVFHAVAMLASCLSLSARMADPSSLDGWKGDESAGEDDDADMGGWAATQSSAPDEGSAPLAGWASDGDSDAAEEDHRGPAAHIGPDIGGLAADSPELALAIACSHPEFRDVHGSGVAPDARAAAQSADTATQKAALKAIESMCVGSARKLRSMLQGKSGGNEELLALEGPDLEGAGGPAVVAAEALAVAALPPDALLVGAAGAAAEPGRPAEAEGIPLATLTEQLGVAMEQQALLSSLRPDLATEEKQNRPLLQYFLEDKVACASLTLEAEKLGVTRKKTQGFLHAAAAACIMLHRRDSLTMLRQITDSILRAGGKAISLTETMRYDETGMRVRLVDRERQGKAASDAIQAFVPTHSQMVSLPFCTDTKRAKILQSLRAVCALFQLPTGSHLLLRFDVPTWLQTMSGGTGRHYERAVRASRLAIPDALRAKFQGSQRLVCTDADAAVEKAERIMEQADDDNCLRTKCEIHRCYIWHGTVFEQVEAQINKLRHLALALQDGDSMRSFRAVLRDVLGEQLDFRPGEVARPREVAKSIKLLDIFAPSASLGNRVKRAVILSLCNGDWSERARVTHRCQGCCTSREHCLSKMTTLFVAATVGAAPKVWPTDRWTGATPAIEWLGLLESVHGLLAMTFTRWAGVKRVAELGSASNHVLALEGDNCDVDHLGGVGPEAELPGESADASVAPSPAAGDPATIAPEIEARRKEQSAWRHSAGTWLAAQQHIVLGTFMVLRLLLRPLAGILLNLLRAASDDWEIEQARRESDARATGQEGAAHRDYHASLASDNVFEGEFLAAAHNLMRDSQIWESLPRSCFSEAFRSRVFCMLSQACCLCHELMVAHKGYPWRLFKLIGDDAADTSRQIESDCEHMQGNWSRRMVCRYMECEDKLLDATLRAELLAVAQVLRRETAQIEAGHASIRRNLKVNSVQTHAVLFEHVSAQRTTQLFRKMRHITRPGKMPLSRGQKQAATSHRRVKGKTKKPRRSPYGGAWRAFVRECTKGAKGCADFKEISAAYRALPPEKLGELREIGRGGASARKAGSSTTFGLKTRHEVAQVKRQQVAQAVHGLASSSKKPKVAAPMTEMSLVCAQPFADPEVRPQVDPVAQVLALQRHVRLQGVAQREWEVQQEHKHIAEMETHGVHDIARIAPHCDIVPSRSTELICSPRPKDALDTITWCSTGVMDRVKAALEGDMRGHQGDVVRGLLAVWSHFHKGIDAPDIKDKEKPHPLHPCAEAGVRMCDAKGMRARNFLQRLEATMKRWLHDKARRKHLYQAQYAVLLVAQQVVRPVPECAWDNGLLPGVPPSAVALHHVGAHMLSPWRGTFHELTGASLCADTGLPTAEVLATATYKYFNRQHFARALDLDMRWCATLYIVKYTGKLIGSFRPDTVRLQVVAGDDHALVWMPIAKPRKKADPAIRDIPDLSGWGGSGGGDGGDAPSDEEVCEEVEEVALGEVPDGGGSDPGATPLASGSEGEPDPGDRPIDMDEDLRDMVDTVAGDDGVNGGCDGEGDDTEAFLAMVGIGDAPDDVADVAPPIDDPPPLPPPLAPPGRPPRGPRVNAKMKLGSGTITWYASKDEFVAVCKHPPHLLDPLEQCRKHRKSIENAASEPQGRPLGFLGAWLLGHAASANAWEHKNLYAPGFDQRCRAREQIKAHPDGPELLQ